MKSVIKVSGKAKQVFKYVELLSRHRGKTTISELAKNNKPIHVDLRRS